MRLCILLNLISLLIFCKQSEKRSIEHSHHILSTDTISVAFYNLENLFDTDFNGHEYPEYNPAISNWNKEMFLKKVSNSADVIAALDPVIIGLCEVENSSALKSLQKELTNRGCHYNYSAIGDFPLKTNTCVALLSKLPVKKVNSMEVRLENGSITRNILEVDVLCKSNTILKVFVNHWPSLRHPESFRIKAANVLSRRLKELPPQTDYILIGDFNSNYNEWEKPDKKHRTKNIETGLNTYLNTIRRDTSQRLVYISEEEMIDGLAGHYDLWLELPSNLRMSESYNGYAQTLDHILLPSSLFDKHGISYIDNSFKTFTWNGNLLKGNTPYRWQFERKEKRKYHTGNGYSDHLPVVAVFHCGAFTDLKDIITPVSSNHGKLSDTPPSLPKSDGWISCNSSVSITNDTLIEGKKVTRFQCDQMESNSSIARKFTQFTGHSLLFNIKGSGKISFRARTRDGKWIYYNAPDFKSSKNARYIESRYTKWNKINIRVDNQSSGTPVEIELRTGKGLPADIFIQEISI